MLNTLDNKDTETISFFPLVFVFIDSLVVSASQDACGYAISRQNNTVGWAYGHVITKISRMGRLPNFHTRSAPLRARGAPLQQEIPQQCFGVSTFLYHYSFLQSRGAWRTK